VARSTTGSPRRRRPATELQIATIGDCLSDFFAARLADLCPEAAVQHCRLQSFAVLAEPGVRPARSLLRRFDDARVKLYQRYWPIAHQVAAMNLRPHPRVILTNMIAEKTHFLYRHRTGFLFYLDDEGLQAAFPEQATWLDAECARIPLDRTGYLVRFVRGIHRLATTYPQATVVLYLPVRRFAARFRETPFMSRHSDIALTAPEAFDQALAGLCRQHENLVVLQADRIVTDICRERQVAPFYVYPYYRPKPGEEFLLFRDLTHLGREGLNAVVRTVAAAASGQRTWWDQGVRVLHPPVAAAEEAEVADIANRAVGDDEIRAMIHSGEQDRLLYGANLADRHGPERFIDDLAQALVQRRDWHDAVLLRNFMLSFMIRHPSPAFWPYLTMLFEDAAYDTLRNRRFVLEWPLTLLSYVRDRLLGRPAPVVERPAVPVVPRRQQRDYWRRMASRLRQDKHRRVAVFPAGRHTKRLLRFLQRQRDLQVVAVYDERPDGVLSAGTDAWTVRHPRQFARSKATAVIISTDTYEGPLHDRFVEHYSHGKSVIRIYGEDAGAEKSER
jgi:hypothetical protein